MGDDELFAMHPHQPNLECPVGYGIGPVLTQIYAVARNAVLESLAAHTISDVLDQTLDLSAPRLAPRSTST